MRLIKTLSVALSLLTLLLFSPSILNAEPIGTTGKISGKVTDDKGVPLSGATVKIEGTNMGATTDDVGDYVIINVPVGTYSVKTSYVGFKSELQTEVRVSADITTTLDFKLTEAGVKTEDIDVIAKRNTVGTDQSGKIITEEFIQNTGIRGIENIAAKTAGVVQDERGGQINVRGGRTNETAVIIDGVLTTNPLDGNSTAYVSNNLLQELAVLTGGFSAEYGNVLSGIINVTTKSGSSKFSGSAEVVSDNFYKRLLDANSQGYNLYSISVGGPLVPTKKLKSFVNFYGGVERNYNQVTGPSWITPELDLPDNRLPGLQLKRWSGNGKLNFDFSQLNKKLNLRLVAGANISRTIDRTFVQSYMTENWQRNPEVRTDNDQFYGKVTHQVSGKLFYEVQFNYFSTKELNQDPYLKDNIFGYGDPLEVKGIPRPGARVPFDAYNMFAGYNRVNNFFSRAETKYIEASINVVSQIKKNEIKIGGSYRYHTIRSFDVRPVALFSYKDSSETFLRSIFDGAIGLANYYGYNFKGNAKDEQTAVDGNTSTFDGAKHPIIAAFYVQDKVEFKDFTINAGLRFDYLNANTWRIKDLTNIVRFGTPGQLDAADFDAKSEGTYAFSPRLGFSFPVTEKTIFHAQYGKFIQLPQLEFLYVGYQNLAFWINNSGFAGSFPNPNLKPEKTTSYEVGVKQQIGDKLNIDLTVFYKETEDLIGIKKYPQLPNQVQVFENQDYGTIRGLDLAVDFRRTNGLAFSIAYSLSYASGTGSDPNSASTAAWLGDQQPKFTNPLDFDQRHTGTLNADFRFSNEMLPKKGVWKSIFQKLGINLLYSFNSGRPYSKKDANTDPFNSTGGGATLQSTINGAVGPWNNRLDLRIDKTVSIADKLNLNFYMYVINVLNSELVNSVWESSGEPGTTGYLSSTTGINAANEWDIDANPLTSTDEFRYLYGLRSKAIGNYGPPRQVRFGIKLSF